jgi:hypothetical protein
MLKQKNPIVKNSKKTFIRIAMIKIILTVRTINLIFLLLKLNKKKNKRNILKRSREKTY